jgi:hypothetical protein
MMLVVGPPVYIYVDNGYIYHVSKTWAPYMLSINCLNRALSFAKDNLY